MAEKVIIYTDGSSRGNPGLSGWAVIVFAGGLVWELVGSQKNATNNQMELQAAIEGLKFAQAKFGLIEVKLHVDSRYVLNGLQSWLTKWSQNNWQTIAKKPVENKKLWQELFSLKNYFGSQLKLIKVLGHSGDLYNDRCDELAVKSALGQQVELFEGSEKKYQEFLKSNPPSSPLKKKVAKSSNRGIAYSYVSLVEGKVYIDPNWEACKKRTHGKKSKYKKVFSKAEETGLIQDYTLESLL